MNHLYDLIVIGAGAIGSAAAYHAARRGLRVLLLEQFEIDHQRGSSYGLSRIIRYAYDHPSYIRMSKASYPMWSELEGEAGESLFVRTGGIDIGDPNGQDIRKRVMALTSEAVPFEVLSSDETAYRFPQFRLKPEQVALYQADAGALRASSIVKSFVRLAQKYGAVVQDHTVVHNISATADGVQVLTREGLVSAGRLIVAAGGWANDLLRHVGLTLPLQVTRCQENYFDAQPESEFEPGRFPAFIAWVQDEWGDAAYGIPSLDGSGLKVAWHGGKPLALPGDSKPEPDTDVSDRVRAFNRQYVPAGDAAVRFSRPCLYTMTPDEHFIIDRHPEHPQIVIGACCSGHAFKFSTLIGSILTDLAADGETAHDIEMFSLQRFAV